jgi:hypothetical protein
MIENMSGGWGIQVGNIEKPEVAIRTPRRNMNTSKKKIPFFVFICLAVHPRMT